MTIDPSVGRARFGVLASAIAAVCAGSAVSRPAHAQDGQLAGPLEEITVTGSRIVRRDFEANSPILTVDQDLFDNTMSVGVEAVLNQLPQFVPAVTQFVTQEVQATATNTPGASTLSLRGLGANRNLVLLDGRRGMPVNASGAVSINTIPSAAIARVETITGGASSVYGADAMAGVVNFILKKDYEGADIDLRYGVTQEGDGEEFRLSGVYGANFSGGEGNVLVGFEYSTRGEVMQADRDFYRDWHANPYVTGTEFFWTDTSYVAENLPGAKPPPGATSSWTNLPTPEAVAAAFGVPVDVVTTPPAAGPGGTGIALGNGGNFYWNPDGSLYKTNPIGADYYTGGMIADNGLVWRKKFIDLDPTGTDTTGQLSENQTNNRLSIPLDRYAMFARGLVNITDNISGFVQGTFSQDVTRTVLQYSPALGGWGTQIPYGTGLYAPSVTNLGLDGLPNTGDEGEDMTTLPAFRTGGLYGLDCPDVGGCTNSQAFPVTPQLAALLDSRQLDPDGPFGPEPIGAPGSGANLPWQLSHVLTWAGPRRTENTTMTYQLVTGLEGAFPIRDWTWEGYVSHGSTQVTTQFEGFGSVERFRFIVTQPNYGRGLFYTGNELGGGFGGGTAQCTTGLPIMEDFTPSEDCIESITADLQNTSRMDQTVVEYNMQGALAELPAGQARFALGTSYRENEFFFMTDILTSQQSFLDSGMGLFPAGNSEGDTSMREAYGELLLPLVSGGPAVDEFSLELGYRYSDAEPSGSIETYKGLFDWRVNDRLRIRGGRQVANRAPNIGELFLSRTQTLGVSAFGDLCSENNTSSPLSAAPGNANAAQVKQLCQELMGPTGALAYYDPNTTQPQGGFSFAFVNTVGNPNLEHETAETMTLGAVIQLANRTSLTVDLYNIDVSNMIAAQSQDSVYIQCFSAANNPTFSADHPACQQVVRDPATGALQPTDVAYSNEGAFETTGVDVQFNWGTDLGPGGLNLNVLATYIDSIKTRVNPQLPWTEWVGTFGPTDLSGVQGGSFDYRTFTTLSYFTNDWNLSLRWRHMPEIKAAGTATPAGTNTLPTPSYNIFDFSGGYTFNDDRMTLRFGIDNLFDKDPPVTNRSPNNPLGSATNSGFYDVLGRRGYVGLSMTF